MNTTENHTAIAVQQTQAKVAGYPYYASYLGTIISMERFVSCRNGTIKPIKLKTLKPSIVGGYAYVTLCDNAGRKKRDAVHRIVCAAFHGKPACRLDVNHKDGDKLNNRADNVEWMTRSENQLHAARIGLKPVGEESHLSKLTGQEVIEIKANNRKLTQSQLAKIYAVSQTCISKIITGKKWKHIK